MAIGDEKNFFKNFGGSNFRLKSLLHFASPTEDLVISCKGTYYEPVGKMENKDRMGHLRVQQSRMNAGEWRIEVQDSLSASE